MFSTVELARSHKITTAIGACLQSLKDGTAVLHDWDDVEREADRIVED